MMPPRIEVTGNAREQETVTALAARLTEDNQIAAPRMVALARYCADQGNGNGLTVTADKDGGEVSVVYENEEWRVF